MSYLDEFTLEEPPPPSRPFTETFRGQMTILGGFVAIIWFLEIVDILVLGGALDNLGVRPRSLPGLWGILFMPFLHGGIGHLLANTVPFLLLGWLVMVRRFSDFFLVSAIAIIVSGVGVWLIAPANSIHLGASGLVFGYFGYLLLRALFERSLAAISIALIVILMYGGLIWGLLPFFRGVSWQGHVFGFIGGALAAYLLTKREDDSQAAADFE